MLLYLIIKEFKQMFRTRLLPVVFVLIPIALTNLLPRIATQEVKGLRFAVVDLDHSTTTRRLTQHIDASAFLSLAAVAPSYSRAMEYINSGEADVIVEFPADYERRLVRGEAPVVQISANATNGIKGNMASAYIQQIITASPPALPQGEGARILYPSLSTSLSGNAAPSLWGRAGGEAVRMLFNPTLDYRLFMVPAVFALVLILIVGFLPALNIVSEKEKGTIEQINVSPIGKMTFILSKIIPYAIVGLLMTLEALAAAKGIHGLAPRGSIALLIGATLLFSMLIASLGLVISNYSSTLQQAALTMLFFLIIFILMSGLLTPIASMPRWAQHLTLVNPTRYFIEVARGIFIKGCTASQLLPQFAALGALTLAGWTWAIASYRKNSE